MRRSRIVGFLFFFHQFHGIYYHGDNAINRDGFIISVVYTFPCGLDQDANIFFSFDTPIHLNKILPVLNEVSSVKKETWN